MAILMRADANPEIAEGDRRQEMANGAVGLVHPAVPAREQVDRRPGYQDRTGPIEIELDQIGGVGAEEIRNAFAVLYLLRRQDQQSLAPGPGGRGEMAPDLQTDQVRQAHRRDQKQLDEQGLLHAYGFTVGQLPIGRDLPDQPMRQVDQAPLRGLG